jgi:hypothetical protein
MWGLIILAAVVLVGISLYVTAVNAQGRVLALLLAVVAAGAVTLGLLAATIGGNFGLPDDQALLLGLFAVIAVSGFVLSRTKTSRPGGAGKVQGKS